MEAAIIRCPDVLRLVGLSKATLYRLVRKGEFPAPVKLASRAVGWKLTDVRAWVASRESTFAEVGRAQIRHLPHDG